MSASNLAEGGGASSQPADGEKTERSPLEGALEALTGELRQKLAQLAGTPEEEAETIIGLFPYGYRTVLENYKLIGTSLARSARRPEGDAENPRLQVHLTDLGRGVIDSCAASREEVDDLMQRVRQLHDRFSDNLEDEDPVSATGEEAEAAEEATT